MLDTIVERPEYQVFSIEVQQESQLPGINVVIGSITIPKKDLWKVMEIDYKLLQNLEILSPSQIAVLSHRFCLAKLNNLIESKRKRSRRGAFLGVCTDHVWQIGGELLQTIQKNPAPVCSPGGVGYVLPKRYSRALMYPERKQAVSTAPLGI